MRKLAREEMDETHRRNQHEKLTKNVFNLLPSEFEWLRSAQQNFFFFPSQVKNFVVRLKEVEVDVYRCVFLSSCISEFTGLAVSPKCPSWKTPACAHALAAHAQNRPGAETTAARCALTAAICGASRPVWEPQSVNMGPETKIPSLPGYSLPVLTHHSKLARITKLKQLWSLER